MGCIVAGTATIGNGLLGRLTRQDKLPAWVEGGAALSHHPADGMRLFIHVAVHTVR
jgi:hypothetical protein